MTTTATPTAALAESQGWTLTSLTPDEKYEARYTLRLRQGHRIAVGNRLTAEDVATFNADAAFTAALAHWRAKVGR